MPTDAEFLAAIALNPQDDTTRLIYADWLDERNDTRAGYLRAEVALHCADAANAPTLRDRFSEARANLDARWIAAMEQPRMLRVNPTPYPAAWWGVEIPPIRVDDGSTYTAYPYASLPDIPLNLIRSELSFLNRPDDPDSNDKPLLSVQRLRRIQGKYRFPPAMLHLFSHPIFMDRLRSCTDCNFNPSKKLDIAPFVKHARFFCFYSDSQGCVHWYLYLHPSGDHCVIASCFDLDFDNDEQINFSDFRYCAPNFETWLARWWLENELVYQGYEDPLPLTSEQQAYMAHYQSTNPQTSG